jgi:hypothetical protein
MKVERRVGPARRQKKLQAPMPAIPHICGSTTVCTSAAPTATSTILPRACRMSALASAASGSAAEIIPRVMQLVPRSGRWRPRQSCRNGTSGGCRRQARQGASQGASRGDRVENGRPHPDSFCFHPLARGKPHGACQPLDMAHSPSRILLFRRWE